MNKFIPREWQESLITTVSKNLEERNTIALEAPTGSGKTSFILYLSFLTDKKIIYLTSVNSEFTVFCLFKFPTVIIFSPISSLLDCIIAMILILQYIINKLSIINHYNNFLYYL